MGILSILIVDDNPIVIKTMEEIIQTLDMDVFIAHAGNGLEAWEIIDNPGNRFDLLISDIEMPEMDGFELAEKVRRYCPGIYIVLMSGRVKPETHEADVFLAKPISMGDLLETIKGLTKPSQP